MLDLFKLLGITVPDAYYPFQFQVSFLDGHIGHNPFAVVESESVHAPSKMLPKFEREMIYCNRIRCWFGLIEMKCKFRSIFFWYYHLHVVCAESDRTLFCVGKTLFVVANAVTPRTPLLLPSLWLLFGIDNLGRGMVFVDIINQSVGRRRAWVFV